MNDPVMKPNPRFGHPASRERPTKVAAALEKNNIAALVASGRDAARAKVHELIPKGAEVFTSTSRTLEELGLAAELDEPGRHNAVARRNDRVLTNLMEPGATRRTPKSLSRRCRRPRVTGSGDRSGQNHLSHRDA